MEQNASRVLLYVQLGRINPCSHPDGESWHAVSDRSAYVGLGLPDVPASRIAERLNVPMLIGFAVMFITGILLFYAVPVRTSQSLWFRIKMVLLVACAVNAFLFHKRLNESVATWDIEPRAPSRIRLGAMLSLTFCQLL